MNLSSGNEMEEVLERPARGGADRGLLESLFLGRHPLMEAVRRQAERAARVEHPVLLTGETGTGKDLLARAIHALSARRAKPPVVVVVSGLRETAWSQLFGHRQGSFTGAAGDHAGLFEEAEASSLIFEDVSELPLNMQAMMLRAVEEGTFRPLGAREDIRSNARILATTNADLAAFVAAGTFRADLYQRLSVLNIELPPLREHVEDLDLYVDHFLRGTERTMAAEARDLLAAHDWPGNVRELKNFVARAACAAEREEIRAEDVRKLLGRVVKRLRTGRKEPGRRALAEALRAAGGNKRKAARVLGVAPGTLYRMMRDYGIAR